MAAPAQILLLTGEPACRQAWQAALEGHCQVVSATDEPAPGAIDVIVTDQPLSAAAAAIDEGHLTRGETGLIAVGIAIPADVALPADHSPRELRLACLLLAEIVRLRRQRETSRRKEKALSHLANTDPLTGLPNRRAWEQHLAERLGRAGEGSSACVALFDIDHFKPLNDQHGHVAGDACLAAVAARLGSAIRRGDFVARLGGDEFAALLDGVEASQAGEVVDRIRRSGAIQQSIEPGGSICVTLSAGWTCLSAVTDTLATENLLEQADAALRRAKQAGRNQACGG
jgi:diguanylate cyclase (GGDEF)-like protein